MIRYFIWTKLGLKKKYIYKMSNKHPICTRLKTN